MMLGPEADHKVLVVLGPGFVDNSSVTLTRFASLMTAWARV